MTWPGIRRRCSAALAVAILGGIAACHRSELPERGSYAARLYARRCSGCHVAYNPGSMTAAMWEVQVHAMEGRMAQAGMPLSDDERHTIVEYLTRNAGG